MLAVAVAFVFFYRVYPHSAAVILFGFAAAFGAFRVLAVAHEFFEHMSAFGAFKFQKRHTVTSFSERCG